MSARAAARDFRGRIGETGGLEVAADELRYETHLGCSVLFKGYLADREATRRALAIDHPKPSDAMIATHAYRRWGAHMQARLSGEYAVVIDDPATGSTILSHDCLGVGTIFYRSRGGEFAFATRIVDLVDAEALGDVDEDFLADFLVRGSATTESTPFRSIRRLLPGFTLTRTAAEVRLIQTWTSDGAPPVACRDDADYAERFLELLGAGVRSALDEGRPSWIALSGGLDSSAVACMAAHGGARDLVAYSVTAEAWPDFDESRWMRAVVEHCGIPWRPVDALAVLPFGRLPDAFAGEPTECVIDCKLLDTVTRMIGSAGGEVLLSGAGGDIVLGGFRGEIPVHLADALFDGSGPVRAVSALAAWRRAARSPRSLGYWLRRGLAEPGYNHLMRRRNRGDDPRALPPWIAADYRRAMRLESRETASWTPRCATPSRQLASDSLWRAGGMTVPWPTGYVQRHPLLYRPLVEFMLGAPWEQKLRPRCDRYLQRRAMKGILPEIVRRRSSVATGTAALVEGLRQSREWRDYLCDSPQIAERGMADREKWREAVRQASVGHTHGDKHFVTTVAMEVWLKQMRELSIPRVWENAA